jgi:hypothetical protein
MSLSGSDIVLRGIDGKSDRWQLETRIEYTAPESVVRKHGGPELIIVKVGFETDLASTPRWLWSLLPPFGKYAGAAIIHDYLYQAHEGTRKQADVVFREAMQEQRVPRYKRELMYRAVRLFGGRGWKNGPRVGGIV